METFMNNFLLALFAVSSEGKVLAAGLFLLRKSVGLNHKNDIRIANIECT